ncbi:MAG: diguanylate cyclase [Agathobacter sp.]|nr:diguanylate cyclase [Agathobacter sp.]
MNVGIIYMITAFVCLLQILSILNRTVATEYKETIDHDFTHMLAFFAVFCSVDALWGLLDAKDFFASAGFFAFSTYIYHLMAALSAFMWLGYILQYTDADDTEQRVLNIFRYLLFAVQFVILLIAAFSRPAFTIDASGEYIAGPSRLFLYTLQYAYYVASVLYCLCKQIHPVQPRALYRKAVLFSLIPLLFGVGQFFFYDVAMYAFGFMITAFAIYSYNVTEQREHFLKERFSYLDKQQSSIISGLAGDFISIYYVNLLTGDFDIFRRNPNGNGIIKDSQQGNDYFKTAVHKGKHSIYHKDMDAFLKEFSRESILKELENVSIYVLSYRIVIDGIPRYFEYRFVRPTAPGEENNLIVGVYNVDAETRARMQKQEEERLAQERELSLKLQAEKLSVDVYIDAMTGLYNRRAYEDDLHHNPDVPPEPDYVYVSLDLNGLKTTNDNLGHDAGDELLRGAAFCMRTCFGSYGKLYRIGGDEFVAMIFADHEKLQDILQDFTETTANWSGKLVKDLSLSCGCAEKSEFPDHTVTELAKIADTRMYEDKAAFYSRKGLDRRGQQEAFHTVCASYTKILRVDLAANVYSIIQMDTAEQNALEGIGYAFTDWVSFFAKSDMIYKDDLDTYIQNMDIEFLRKFFSQGTPYFCMFYRRRINGIFRRVMLELIPSLQFSDENQVVFLFVKNIDDPTSTQ